MYEAIHSAHLQPLRLKTENRGNTLFSDNSITALILHYTCLIQEEGGPAYQNPCDSKVFEEYSTSLFYIYVHNLIPQALIIRQKR
jgi:hypothetical protein